MRTGRRKNAHCCEHGGILSASTTVAGVSIQCEFRLYSAKACIASSTSSPPPSTTAAALSRNTSKASVSTTSPKWATKNWRQLLLRRAAPCRWANSRRGRTVSAERPGLVARCSSQTSFSPVTWNWWWLWWLLWWRWWWWCREWPIGGHCCYCLFF